MGDEPGRTPTGAREGRPAAWPAGTGAAALAERIEREAAAFAREHAMTWHSAEALLIAKAMLRIARAIREEGQGG
jgi:hypothetical protein